MPKSGNDVPKSGIEIIIVGIKWEEQDRDWIVGYGHSSGNKHKEC